MAMGYKPVCGSYIEHVYTNRKKKLKVHIVFYKTLNYKFVIHKKKRKKEVNLTIHMIITLDSLFFCRHPHSIKPTLPNVSHLPSPQNFALFAEVLIIGVDHRMAIDHFGISDSLCGLIVSPVSNFSVKGKCSEKCMCIYFYEFSKVY
jgi:hypothetical protein